LIAVTGTNGKTTTTSLIDSVLRASGAKTGLFGTIAYHTPLGEYPAPNTTPESLDLQGFFAEIRDAGGSYAVLEASSHALVRERLWGCQFQSAVFTNLTRDHLDFHHNFEDYFAAKRRLFEGTGAGAPETAILNADDPYSERLAGLAKQSVTYGIEIQRTSPPRNSNWRSPDSGLPRKHQTASCKSRRRWSDASTSTIFWRRLEPRRLRELPTRPSKREFTICRVFLADSNAWTWASRSW